MDTTPAQQQHPEKVVKDRRWRQIALAILALLIGIIFLSSYFTLQNIGGGNTQQKQNTTAAAPQTVYGVATANAIITGYSNTTYIAVSCKNASADSSVSSKLSRFVTALEHNNSVYNSYSLPNETVVQAGNMDTTALYGFFRDSFNATSFSCLGFSAAATIQLPASLSVFIVNKSYSLLVPASLRYSQIPVTLTQNMSNVVKVRVSALVTDNGTLYSLSTAKLE